MAPTTGKRSSYVVTGCLAGAVLYFALDLSSSGRGWIDYTVIGLVIAAIAWNVVQLARKLHAAAGAAGVWHVLRTLLFWIVGLFNTALIRPDEVGSWKNWLGWVLVLIAVGDTVALFFRERGLAAGRSNTAEDPRPSTTPPQ